MRSSLLPEGSIEDELDKWVLRLSYGFVPYRSYCGDYGLEVFPILV